MPDVRAQWLCLLVCGLAGLPEGWMTRARAGEPADLRSQFILELWKKERGLPDNAVNAITQTADGYLWIGTRAGLARFDGVRFTVFNRAAFPEMPSDEIFSLAPGEDDELWIGTAAGLVKRSSRGFLTMLTGLDSNCSRIGGIFVSRTGSVWIAARCGLYELRNGQLKKKPFNAGPMFEDQEGRLWFNVPSAFRQFDPITEQLSEPICPPNQFRWGLPHSSSAVRDALSPTIWAHFGEYQHSQHLVDKQWVYAFTDGKWTLLSAQPFSNGARPFFVTADPEGGFWIPNARDGLLRYQDGAFASLSFSDIQVSDHPTCLFHDRDGNLWVGTETAGLIRARPKKLLTYAASDGLPDDNAWTLCQGSDGSVWIGTDGGVSRFHNGQFTNFTEQHGLPRNTIRSIVEDQAGTLWVGTGNGLSLYTNGQWRTFPLPGGLGGNKIRVLHALRSGELLVGRQIGLVRIANGVATEFPELRPFGEVDPRALLEDRMGRVWIGTHGHGLFRLSTNGGLERFSTTNGLASDLVWAFHQDTEGTVWIGTDRGLHRYRDGQFAVFTDRDGLFDRGVNHILEDDSEFLWISCDRGIYRVRKQELEAVAAGRQRRVSCVTYGIGDGLLSAETNGQKSQPAGCRARDGRLWFPTTKGVVVFDPKHLPDGRNPPQVVIEQIRTDGKSIHDNARLSPMDDNVSLAGTEATLAPGSAHVLEIQYTANTMVEADKLTFKYRLEGLDRDWIEAGRRRTATYAHLRPGHYRFAVLAVNKYDVTSEPASFSFHLRPRFYQTWLFYLGCAGALGGFVFGVYRWRLGYVRRIHRLERERALAEDRARIAKDLHDGLGAQLTNLAILANVSAAGSNGDSSETRLRKLSHLARETALQLREIIWANHPGDETLEGLVSRICQYAEQSLAAAGICCRLDIAPELPVITLNTDARHHLHLAAKEALNNVLKHAGATEVRIRSAVDQGRFSLSVEDNGCGMDHIPCTGRGHGLNNMRRRIEFLRGELVMASTSGRGTTVRFDVPLQALSNANPNRTVCGANSA